MDLSLINVYPEEIKERVIELYNSGRLGEYITNRYPQSHHIKSDKMLFNYVKELKSYYMKRAKPLHRVYFSDSVEQVYNALGFNRTNRVVQGRKAKVRNEIVIASLFKNAPEEFLEMIVIHELAHLKVKEHNKEFYRLCMNMNARYHQLEFDLRLYLIYRSHL